MKPNRLRDAAIARAHELKLTAAELADRCAGAPNADHINRYLTGHGEMNSWKLARLLRELGLCVMPANADINASLKAIGEPDEQDDMSPDEREEIGL